MDAARQGHLACLQFLHKQGNFLRFHDHGRAEAGEVRRAEAWLAALAACDGRHPEILKWLLAGGWPRPEAERFPWQFRDVADPSLLTWYTGGRPSLMPRRKALAPSLEWPFSDVTAVDWSAQGEWSEMAEASGQCEHRSGTFFREKINGSIWGEPGAQQAWYPQEFQVLWRACRSGNFACQRVIVEAGCRSPWVTVLAALTGQLEFFKFSIEQGCPCMGSTLVAAAAGGHVDCFGQVMTAWFDIVDKVPTHSRVGKDPVWNPGQRCLSNWFFSTRFEVEYGMGTYGNRYLDRKDVELWIVKAALAAAENGNLAVLKCVMTRHAQTIRRAGTNPANAAVARGRLSCLEFACKHGCTPCPAAVERALEAGHTDCVLYLMSHRIRIGNISIHAAKSGLLELLELQAARDEITFMEGGPFPDEAALDYMYVANCAAVGGQLACLRFAFEKGEPRTPEHSLRNAAAGGHVMCMRYLHEKGYRAPKGTLSATVESGSLQSLEYAFEIGCAEEEGLMVKAARRGVEFVQCLHERGFPWEKGTTETAAGRGCLATLQYCHEHGCAWNPGVIKAAIHADSAACLQYIHTHDCPPLPWPCPPAYNLEVLQYAVKDMGMWGERLLQATSAYLHAEDQHQFADWRLLMYMLQKGVALPPVLLQAAELRIARFKAVVSCFHLATRLAAHGGPHAPKWRAMGTLPQDVLERIAQLAHLKL